MTESISSKISSISSLSSAAFDDALTCPASSALVSSEPPFFWMRFCSCSGTVAPFRATSYRRSCAGPAGPPWLGLETIDEVGGRRRGVQQLLYVLARAFQWAAHGRALERLSAG